MTTPQAIAIIPARFASTRLPGKPLLAETGKPLIQHVIEQVQRAASIARAIVATDDPRIAKAIAAFGGEAAMTREDHPNGTSRIAEVAAGWLDAGQTLPPVIVNVQGDEPELDPAMIDRLVEAMLAEPDVPMATIASPFAAGEDASNPNIVKVVCDQRGRALYFSRARIPHDRDGDAGITPLKHAGVYAYRPDFLLKYVTLAPTPLEQAEKLEQLRALEHGHAIRVLQVASHQPGIDTPEQYAAFVRRCARGA